MRFATLNLTSSLDSSVLVGFASLEELSSDEAFDLLLAECSTGSDVTREVVWYRSGRPSRLPSNCRPSVERLSKIHLRYTSGRTVTAIAKFCASIHCLRTPINTLIVEFENNEIPHEASCATVLALLSDTGRWIRQARMPQAGQIADDLPPVIAIIRPNNKFDHLMITSLYTDCMVLIHGKANVENALA
ncbi:hypothetical protein Tcan_13046 [Toxocara canis]|uniref:Uncharacterized protein n=1 Tax=Toxocara canis TaxID=6265 RepID=A0A0B2UW67_TOXCA|nr:hypothetical protein Tcan_13046 [Toxocara canis]